MTKMNFKKILGGFTRTLSSKVSGFTLIELLVVVAIIGLLSSVVLASLKDARVKGVDAAIKENLSGARSQAELYYNTNTFAPNTYSGVCTTGPNGGANTILANVQAASTVAGTGVVNNFLAIAQVPTTANCHENVTAWAASVKLKKGALYFCVDSNGASKETTLLLGSAVVCP